MNYKVFYGGWYQRTTLHLTEVYDLLSCAKSNLPLDSEKLVFYKNSLGFVEVSRKNGYLEYIEAKTAENIIFKYFEDGLYVLELDGQDIRKQAGALKEFYELKLSPAISYIFSLGAPTPKVLANIKTVHPIVIAVTSVKPNVYKIDSEVFGNVYSTIESNGLVVNKTPEYIVIVSKKGEEVDVSNLVEMQIFFREFKDQLERYLNIHRKVWEEITLIKDKGEISGKDISKNKNKLDSYDRSINLISNRINQMSAYVKTRQSISKEFGVEEHLMKVFDYKFETLTNTLTYIKEIWAMTKDYVKNVNSVLTDLENQSLNNSVKSLQLVTSIGVVSGIIGYLSKTEIPTVTKEGGIYIFLLVGITLTFNLLILYYYKNIKYKLKISSSSNSI